MTPKNKLDCVSEFAKKWLAYQRVASDWILAIDRLGLSSVSHYDWLAKDEVFRKFEKTLKKHNVKQPDLAKIHQEANEAAIPILEFLFGPNETPIIPEFPDWFPGGYDEWCKKTHDMDLDMMHRIMGARNRILSSEFKTRPKLIPRSGWSNPYSITHWAKVFNISRKTMQNWLKNNQILARQVGSKWQIACEELPAADDKDTSV
ncbi:MAG: helix-turn-helix domain-containing protein [Candidatus Omnitrophica bacterium]|nr:helix-turn-helix domain-containing protein [Candidatus Omnitrophota bacterium]